MTRRFLIFAGLLLVCGAAGLQAHVAFRVTGKITKWDRPTLTVVSKEHGTVMIKVEDDFAEILLKGKPAATKDFKAGQNVVIDAWGDTITDLEALKVSVVSPATPATKK